MSRTITQYQDFLHQLDRIELKLTDERINFDPGSSFSEIERSNYTATIKSAWCLHRLIVLLRNVVKQPPGKTHALFPFTSFSLRLYQALPQLSACMKLLIQMQAEVIREPQGFIIAVLFWEILQSLNPSVCPENRALWETLYHGSAAWKESFTRLPRQLYSRLRIYFHTQDNEQKLSIFEKIRELHFHAALQIDMTPDTLCNMLERLKGNLSAQILNWPIQYESDLNEITQRCEDRIRTLKYLRKKLESHLTVDAKDLESYLSHLLFNILDCFDSPIKNPNTYSYLRPSDKLKFIFDGIVQIATEEANTSRENYFSDLKNMALDLGSAFLPQKVTDYIMNSPGEIYLRTKWPEYQPIELNHTLYHSLHFASSRKEHYRKDGKIVIDNMIDCIRKESVLKQKWMITQNSITDYLMQRTQFIQQLCILHEIMIKRFEQIDRFNDSSEFITQYEETYRSYFGRSSIEEKCRQLNALKLTISPLDTNDLLEGSILDRDIKKLNQVIVKLHEEDFLSLANQFQTLLETTQRFEGNYQDEQARFAFPQTNTHIRVRFPYLSLLGLLFSIMGMTLSIGLLIGSHYFTFLMLPIVINYTIPICALAIGLCATMMVKASLDLLRYRFFTASLTTQNDSPTNSLQVLQI